MQKTNPILPSESVHEVGNSFAAPLNANSQTIKGRSASGVYLLCFCSLCPIQRTPPIMALGRALDTPPFAGERIMVSLKSKFRRRCHSIFLRYQSIKQPSHPRRIAPPERQAKHEEPEARHHRAPITMGHPSPWGTHHHGAPITMEQPSRSIPVDMYPVRPANAPAIKTRLTA